MMPKLWKQVVVTAMILVAASAGAVRAADLDVRHGYADSNGVKIHYATLGAGPLVVMIHGFPDYWYTWRAPDGRRWRIGFRSWRSISAATT